MPQVSLGLPIFNGERYVREAVDSVLRQSFEDFELVICDNASTDSTPEICREYAARDERVRLVANDENIGAAPNFNKVFELCGGDYFKWVAHDDTLAPDFLGECVKVLDADAGVVLCHSEVQFIGSDGEFVRDYDAKLEHIGSERARLRFRDMISLGHWCIDVFGLIRRDVLARTPLIASYLGSDRNLLAELALHGRFHRVPRVLFFSREHADRSIRSHESEDDRAAWFDPALKEKKESAHRRRLVEYARSVRRVPLSIGERLGCYAALVGWVRRYRRLLIEEWRGA